MAQMKEQINPLEKELNEVEISRVYLSDAEFKTLVIRMLKELSEYCSNIKKSQAEIKDNTNGKEQFTENKQYSGQSQESNK